MKRAVSIVACCAVALALAGCAPGKHRGAAPAADSFYTPAEPPTSRYVIDARFDAGAGTIEGRETIHLKNAGRDPLGVVAVDWTVNPGQSLEIAVAGRRLFPGEGAPPAPRTSPIFIRLPEPLAPGASVALDVSFGTKTGSSRKPDVFTTSRWFPRLWWDGLAHHDAFSVKLDVPEGVAVAAGGRLDPKTGRYEAAAAREFGLCLAPGLKTAGREVDGVLIRTLFTDKGAKAAAICLETAADAVHFYKNWLGFYPFPFLNIIPGGAGRLGGYPVATGIVAIHGLETYVDGESPRHWQHITSHEIGHQYWGEWVLDPDTPAWTWIALGIFADTEFMTVRGFDPDRRAGWMGNYIRAIPLHYDMTLDAPPDREDAVKFDFNNTVVHSKGPATIFALDSVLGRDAFLRIYKRCLRDFGGRRLGWRDLRAAAEAESGRNLAWFFDAWVRSNQYLCYGVEEKDCRPDGKGGFVTEVRVKRLGTMSMPMPVQTVFEDGSTQTDLTDRTLAVTTLTFKSRSPLRDVVIDPEKKLARVEKPVPEVSAAAARALAFGWDSNDVGKVYDAVKGEPITAPEIWYNLGLDLYAARRLDDAADCFAKVGGLDADPLRKFGALGWLGLLCDLKGRRAEAVAHYKAALAVVPDRPVKHDGFKITMDKAWIEERLRTPFTPETRVSMPEHPTAAELVDLVAGLNWSGEGETALAVFRKTPGLTITDAFFWYKLGLLLADGRSNREALTAFRKIEDVDKSAMAAFGSRVWQGHMHDLLGDRAAAIACYKAALKVDPGSAITHSQWGMKIDTAWVEARLVSPFSWKK